MKAPVAHSPASPVGSASVAATLQGLWLGLALLGAASFPGRAEPPVTTPPPRVSYYREIRPVLQANCQGCHQPAKAKGGYSMTDYKGLLMGGENEGAAVSPGHPEKSSLLKMVNPQGL